jgi:DNA-binding transcriptional LysR family regulator
MNLRQIEVFRAVMLSGSVTDAARLLHVSQPGVSRMLGHIELQLGLPLFERRRGKLQPTPEAQALYAEVEHVYQAVQRVDARARDLKDGGGLVLRVLTSPSTGLQLVPQAVAQLVQQVPGARLYLESVLAREMVERLTHREADLAISTLALEHALLRSEVVGHWSLVCVCPPGHRLAARRALTPADVLRERLVVFSADTPQGAWVAQSQRDSGITADAPIEVRSGQMACALAASGAGIAVVDSLTAQAWSGERLQVRTLRGAPVYPVYAVRAANAASSVLDRSLCEAVRAACGPAPG